jgi:hypothetical protein
MKHGLLLASVSLTGFPHTIPTPPITSLPPRRSPLTYSRKPLVHADDYARPRREFFDSLAQVATPTVPAHVRPSPSQHKMPTTMHRCAGRQPALMHYDYFDRAIDAAP